MTEDEVIGGVHAILNARNQGVELRSETRLGGGGLGLDSIALVEVLLQCEDRFGVEIAAQVLSQSPLTVGLLVQHIRAPGPVVSRGHHLQLFDRARDLLARAAVSHPRAVYRLAAGFGAVRHRVTRRWPTAGEVHALFPHLGSRAAARTAAHISALEERNHVLVRGIRRYGIHPVQAMISPVESLATMEGPRILGTFHVGALHAVGAVLERLRSPVLAFRSGRLFTPQDSLQVQSTKGDEQARAAALHRAVLHLRRGGLVVLALDVVQDHGIETRCLGRSFCLAAGAFALARWTGTPIVPLVARWTSSGVCVETSADISTPEEMAMWLERYLLESPAETTLGLLRTLLGVS
ncbi:MAG TPA: phosphopantetheine-binding protein [Thermoanaerobaculia bacterium]